MGSTIPNIHQFFSGFWTLLTSTHVHQFIVTSKDSQVHDSHLAAPAWCTNSERWTHFFIRANHKWEQGASGVLAHPPWAEWPSFLELQDIAISSYWVFLPHNLYESGWPVLWKLSNVKGCAVRSVLFCILTFTFLKSQVFLYPLAFFRFMPNFSGPHLRSTEQQGESWQPSTSYRRKKVYLSFNHPRPCCWSYFLKTSLKKNIQKFVTWTQNPPCDTCGMLRLFTQVVEAPRGLEFIAWTQSSLPCRCSKILRKLGSMASKWLITYL